MKKLVFLCAAILLIISGCIGQKTTNATINTGNSGVVVNGSMVSVDYVGSEEGGKIFDTSIESVAKENDIYVKNKKYQPLEFKVGSGQVIKGFDEGVIGMKVGDTKTIVIPPEKGYGPSDPSKIMVIPISQSFPASNTFPKQVEIPADRFKSDFGNHSVGDIIQIPSTNINLTIKNIGTNVTLIYNLNVGDKITQKGSPWNQTVVSADNNNITIVPDIKVNDTITLPNVMWNSTVVGLNSTNITLRHNPIPDKHVSTSFGFLNIHFNDTSVIIDQNSQLAGKTLIFKVTLKAIK